MNKLGLVLCCPEENCDGSHGVSSRECFALKKKNDRTQYALKGVISVSDSGVEFKNVLFQSVKLAKMFISGFVLEDEKLCEKVDSMELKKTTEKILDAYEDVGALWSIVVWTKKVVRGKCLSRKFFYELL